MILFLHRLFNGPHTAYITEIVGIFFIKDVSHGIRLRVVHCTDRILEASEIGVPTRIYYHKRDAMSDHIRHAS